MITPLRQAQTAVEDSAAHAIKYGAADRAGQESKEEAQKPISGAARRRRFRAKNAAHGSIASEIPGDLNLTRRR